MRKKQTLEEFIERANLVHNNKFNYSLSNLNGMDKKIKIICPIHGEFEQNANNHLQGQDCKKCSLINRQPNIDELINNFKMVQGDKYNYSMVDYINNKTKIKIICPEHGIFEQRPTNHLNGNGCPNCNGGIKNTKIDFIEKAVLVHCDKYCYSLVEYVNDKTKIKIVCSKHGEFEQTPNAHLNGQGCSKCANLIRNSDKKLDEKTFINKCKIVHGDRYDYTSINYVDLETKINIICKEHGKFNQLPKNHLYQKNGCPICNDSKGEKEILKFLINSKVTFIKQHKFPNCKHIRVLPFDFYLPDLNTCIEYDGEQHSKPVKYFGGNDKFLLTQIRDKIKTEYCQKNNIPLIRINYTDIIIDKLSTLI